MLTLPPQACMFSEDCKKCLQTLLPVAGGSRTMSPALFSFPPPSFSAPVCHPSWPELDGMGPVGGWPCTALWVLPLHPGTLGYPGRAAGGRRAEGLLSSLLASPGDLCFLPAEFFPPSLGM